MPQAIRKQNAELFSSVVTDKINYNHVSRKITEPDTFAYHTHDRFELIFIIKGDIKYIVEGKTYKLAPGDLILTRPASFHIVIPEVETQYERYDIIIDEKNVNKAVIDRIPKDQDVFRCGANERIFEMFSRFDYYYEKYTKEEYGHLAFNIAEEIIYNLILLDTDSQYGVINPLIDKATDYIMKNLIEIQSVEEIRDALYITKSHLHHLFSKYLHMTPAKYIMSKRLLKAQKKIYRGAKPTEVFTECGFDDYATFFRNYKRYFGYPPSSTVNMEITREII